MSGAVIKLDYANACEWKIMPENVLKWIDLSLRPP